MSKCDKIKIKKINFDINDYKENPYIDEETCNSLNNIEINGKLKACDIMSDEEYEEQMSEFNKEIREEIIKIILENKDEVRRILSHEDEEVQNQILKGLNGLNNIREKY